MLQFFRSFMKSKFGIGFTLVFLVVIALAFGIGDVAGNQTFGGIAGGDRAAVVGSQRISTSELSTSVTNAFEQARQSNPTLTMQAFLAEGGLDSTLNQVISRTALAEFGRKYGLRAGKRLVDSELAQIPAFQGPDGKFDKNAFLQVLAQRQLTEAAVREDFAANLFARQILSPVAISPIVPQSFALRYASLLREHRQGSIGVLPSALFAPTGDPTDAQLQAFYQQHRNAFMRPERRVIRYAAFGEEALGALPPPTDAQIAQRYQRDQAKYAAVENRTFTQLVLPTEAAANAVLAEVKGGKSLSAAAQEKGLRAATVGPVNRQAYTATSSAAVAAAGFGAAQGALLGPTRGGLGWYLVHVDKIDKQPARSLDQVRGEISAALAQEQRTAALADLSARIEEAFDKGTNLGDVAKQYKIDLLQTAPVTADGHVYGKPAETIPPVLTPVLKTAFEMEEAQPQIAPVEQGKRFVMFDVPQITASAVAPLAEIRADVVTLWRRDEGDKAASAAADAVLARVAKGATLADALRAVKPNAPPAKQLNVGREDLAKQGRVPPELALFFTMGSGSAKKLQAAGEAGWFVLKLDHVEAGKVDPNDPAIAQVAQQIAKVNSDEQVAEFAKATEKEVGVTRNPAAIRGLVNQLTGHTAS